MFVSYAREDRATAQQLADALQGVGLRVWWDRDILGGSEFSDVIERELTGAKLALVMWSRESVRSSFVRDESARARDAGKLLPLRIEAVAPPLGFGQIHTLDLLDWHGDTDAPAFAELLAHVRRRLAGGGDDAPLRLPRTRAVWPARRALFTAGGVALAAGASWLGWHWWDAPDTARAEALTSEGVENLEKKEFEQARLHFNQALVADPDYAPALYFRAQMLIQSKALDAARADLQRALALKTGLDGGQLGEAQRWLAELTVAPSEPAPLARAAAAERPGTPPPATAPAQPMPSNALASSVPLSGAAADKVNAAVEQMFSANKDQRQAATTSLIADAEATSDAVAPAVRRALQVQSAGVPKDPALQSGVINALVLMQSATPGTLVQHGGEIKRLLEMAKDNGPQTLQRVRAVGVALEQAQKIAPAAFLQIAGEGQRALAQAIAARLRGGGYSVPPAEVVSAKAPPRTEIRVHGRSDQGLARWMANALRELTGGPVVVLTLRNATPKDDTFEIWLDAALCTAARRPSACG